MNEEPRAVEVTKPTGSLHSQLRTAIQRIPVVGGEIDTLILGRTGQIHATRLEEFVQQLSERIGHTRASAVSLQDDAFSDLVASTFEKVAHTRSQTKRQKFAEILARQVVVGGEWEDAEAAVRLLAELEELHVAILTIALHAPLAGKPFEGLRVISPVSGRRAMRSQLDERSSLPLFLPTALANVSSLALRRSCVDLLSRGLLHDQGAGGFGMVPLEVLAPTDLAEWFASWVGLSSE